MPIPTSKYRFSAFTLIELLTVIAIIGILAAIIIPTIRAVRKKGYQAKSISNLRQLQLAHIQYASEHRDYLLPPGKEWMRNTDFRAYFGYEPYDDAKKNDWMPAFRSGFWPDRMTQASIGMNSTVRYNPKYSNGSIGDKLRVNDIESPARTFCFAEGIDWQLHYSARHLWDEDNDTWQNGKQSVAYRVSGNKCIAVAYAGNVFLFTSGESDNQQLWYPQRSDWQ